MQILKRSLTCSVFVTFLSCFASGVTLPPSESPLFQATSTVTATFTADFTALWAKAKNATLKPGHQSASGDDAYVDGSIVYADENGSISSPIPVKVRVRGHSSQTDCPFPKLKLEFKDTDVAKTIFRKAENVKIATHCADVEGNSGGFQRLRNQKEPHREVVAYQILEALSVPSFKARSAIISYVDQGNGNTVTKRAAAFIEDEFDKRLKSKEIFVKNSAEQGEEDEKIALANKDVTDPTKLKVVPGYFEDAKIDTVATETAKVIFAEGLLGNVDWDFKLAGATGFGMTLWNVKAFISADGVKFLVPFDFDLARIATDPTSSEMQSYITGYLGRARSGFGDDVANTTADYFFSMKKTVEDVIDAGDFNYPDTKSGKMVEDKDAKKHMKAFLKYFWNLTKNKNF